MILQRKRSGLEKFTEWLGPRLKGGIVGALVMFILGFSVFGWTFGGTAERVANERARSAVVAVLAPVCAEKFMAQPNAAEKFAEFQKITSWQQPEFLLKGGWVMVAGDPGANADLVAACAQRLAKISKT